MKIIFSIADLQPESGGPTRSVSALAEAVAHLDGEVELVALEYGDAFPKPMLTAGAQVKSVLVPCRGRVGQRLKWAGGFAAALQQRCQSAEKVLLHDNGLWLPTNHLAARVARAAGVPLVISPRGMLTPWAMRFHGWKKRLAWQLYQHRNLASARLLHATSRDEAEGFRTLGLKQPIAIIPNGVSLPPENRKSEIGNRKSEIRTALFLSRIHPKKGLLELVEAWHQVRPAGWRVVIAGGDEGGHREVVKAEIRKLKLEKEFEFIGEVADEKKWDVYRSADLFVLPTHSENFGIVIAEALACGVPVITTTGTPWEELNTQRCGWWVEIGAGPFAAALRQALSLSDEERQAMGLRGRWLVEENYTWPAAAKRMLEVYRWVLGESSKPDCVLL